MSTAPSPLLARFLRYVTNDTHAIEDAGVRPSNPAEREFLDMLAAEIADFETPDLSVSRFENGAVMVVIPATEGCERAPRVCLVAHVDTYPGVSGLAVPIVHDYQGGDIVLPNGGTTISVDDLEGLDGCQLISASGDTLLGADDKAGVTMLMEILKNMRISNTDHEFRHGRLTFLFCPDEEIGELGLEFVPADEIAEWDLFLTVDGLAGGTIDIGCFFGAKCEVVFKGVDAHPGPYGQKIRHAGYAACMFVSDLSRGTPQPWDSDGDDEFNGFVYATGLIGFSATEATVKLMPRAFENETFGEFAETIGYWANQAAEFFETSVEVGEMEIIYVSTELAIAKHLGYIELLEESMEASGLEPRRTRVRGGTDGAMLNKTHPNIPAPNIGTGARNLHGLTEFLVVSEFEASYRALGNFIDKVSAVDRADF